MIPVHQTISDSAVAATLAKPDPDRPPLVVQLDSDRLISARPAAVADFETGVPQLYRNAALDRLRVWATTRQRRLKSAGGRWDPVRRVWMLLRDVAERPDLMPRVVGGGG